MASTVLPNGIIIPEKYSRDWYNDLYHNWQELDNLLGGGTPKDGILTIQKNGDTVGTFSANQSTNETINITVPTKTSDLTNDSGFITEDTTKIPLAGSNQISGSLIPSTNGTVDLGGSSYQWNNAYIKSLTINGVACGDILTHNASEFMPRSGGAVMTGTGIGRTTNSSFITIDGGTDYVNGAELVLYGKDSVVPNLFGLYTYDSTNTERYHLHGVGSTLSWSGTAIQYTSDQRLKQQISEIDDALLDAWEDVDLVQFKYNDAVDTKKDKARLHTGYVVQQIDKACQSHGVDVSKYGLYCHEEYKEETREVEHEDGTKTTEVIRPASEHYSLRYTEVYAVECMYLRRCIARLTARIEELEKGNNTK